MIGDAKGGLESEPDGSFDVIIMDLSDPLDGGPCYQLYTTDFYRILSKSSRPGEHLRHAERMRVGARRASRVFAD